MGMIVGECEHSESWHCRSPDTSRSGIHNLVRVSVRERLCCVTANRLLTLSGPHLLLKHGKEGGPKTLQPGRTGLFLTSCVSSSSTCSFTHSFIQLIQQVLVEGLLCAGLWVTGVKRLDLVPALIRLLEWRCKKPCTHISAVDCVLHKH